MINNNYDRLVNSFGMVKNNELNMVGCSLNTEMRLSVCLSVYLSSIHL